MKELNIDDEEKMMAAVDMLMAELDSVLETPQEVDDQSSSEEPVEDPSEPESHIEIHEEFTGKLFNLILYKPSTRRYTSVVVQINSEKELAKKIEEEYPGFIIYHVYEITEQPDYSRE